MENEIILTDKQREAFKKAWFIYGNDGKKCTPLNHKLIQGFYQYGEDRREAYTEAYQNMTERFGKEYADKNALTQECLDVCNKILSNP